jgi:hypothetical protein
VEAPAHWSATEKEDFEERAAILEYQANLPRVKAEIIALREIEARRTRERKKK